MALIIAHRGASFDAPENTLAAFKLAWEQGADGIEGDFYLTADGQVVTLHDATFKRTGGLDRKPSELTVDQIRTLDVGTWKDPKFTGERAPLIGEVLATLPPGKLMFIEVKCGPEILPVLKREIELSGLPLGQLRLICFKSDVIAASKQLMPALKAYWLTSFKADEGGGEKHPTLDEVLATLRKCNADGVDAKADLEVVDDLFVQSLHRAGFETHFWTVDEPQTARRLVELGAGSITTNRPALIREEGTRSPR